MLAVACWNVTAPQLSGDYTAAREAIFATEHHPDGFRINAMLLGENACGKRFIGVVVQNRYGYLEDDWTCIQLLIDKVNGAPRDLHPVLERLMLRVKSRESRQQRRMDVHDAIRERLDKFGAEQAKKSCEAHEVNLISPEFLDHEAVVHRPVKAPGWKADGIESALASDLKACGGFSVGDDDCNLGVQATLLNGIGDGAKIRSSA